MRGFQPAGGKPQAKKSAGPVRGPGTGTSDEVADTVQEGTYIMPTDSTEAIGEQNLAAMGKGAPVDVQLSNGEFKLPPEQVHAIGVQALDQMKDATHTPVAARGFAPGAQQEAEPPLFFANGGVVDEENAKRFAQVPASFGNRGNNTFGAAPAAEPVAPPAQAPVAQAASAAAASPNQASPTNIFPQSSPAAGANIYSGAGFTADQFGSSGKFAQVPNSIGHQPGRQQPAAPAVPAAPAPQGMTDAQREQVISQIPTGGVTAPARPAPAPPIDLRTPPSGFSSGQPASQPLDAQAASDRAKFGAAWETVKDVNDSAGRAIADVAMLVPRGFVGAYDSAVVRPMRAAGINASYLSPSLVPNGVDPSSMTPYTDQKRMQEKAGSVAPSAPAATSSVAAAAPPATPSAPLTTVSTAGAGRGSINPPAVNPDAPATTSSQPGATQITPGVFRSGNSYAGTAADAIAGAQTRGLPSAQNVAAADALAQRSQADSMARVMAGQPVERGWSGVIGTDPAAGNAARERRDLVSSLTTPLRGAQNGQLTAAQRNGMLSLLDQEARGAQAKANNATTLQQTEMQTNTQRDMAAMREAGENSRDGARNAIDQDRLGLERDVRGFAIRHGQREEKLHEKYQQLADKGDTKGMAQVAQQIRDLSGKAEPTNRYTVVPGGQEWDATAGAMRNVPGRVLNNQTGQFVEQQGATSAQPAGIPKVGDTRDGYRYKGGNPNDKANWQKV